MKDGKILILGLVGILVLVVASSGCPSTTQTSSNVTSSTPKTFSYDTISFNYPSNYENAPNPKNITSEISNWQDITYLRNQNNIEITVTKNPKADSAASERDNEQNIVRANPDKNNNKILVTTTKTNPNGIVVEIGKHNVLWPNTVIVERYYDMYISADGVVYLIYVHGNVERAQEINETGDLVFNTLKIS